MLVFMRRYDGTLASLQFLQKIVKCKIISFEKLTPLFILDMHNFEYKDQL